MVSIALIGRGVLKSKTKNLFTELFCSADLQNCIHTQQYHFPVVDIIVSLNFVIPLLRFHEHFGSEIISSSSLAVAIPVA